MTSLTHLIVLSRLSCSEMYPSLARELAVARSYLMLMFQASVHFTWVSGQWSKVWSSDQSYLVKLRDICTVHTHQALQVRGRARPLR